MPLPSDRHPSSRANALRSLIVSFDDRRFSLSRCFDEHLGLRLRAEEVHRRIQRALAGSHCGWDRKEMELHFDPGASPETVESLLHQLVGALAVIGWRPLTPRLAATALGISGQERVRRTKDGRLPSSGSVSVRRRNLMTLSTYSVDVIEHLAAHPEILAAWRERDTWAKSHS